MAKVLIISNPEDEHTQVVLEKLTIYGGEPTLLYPEEFGTSAYLSMSFEQPGWSPQIEVLTKSCPFDLHNFDSIWYRRPRAVSLALIGADTEAIEFARDEWKTFIHDSYDFLDSPLWVSKPSVLRTAANKPLQLSIAQSLGLRIPRTLMTNDPNRAANFIASCNGKVVVKAVGRGWVYSTDGVGVTYVLTNRLSKEDITDLGDLEVSPVTIQEEIAKDFEVRLNVVGQQCLGIKIDSQRSAISEVDWRRYDVSNTPYGPFQLPVEIEEKCLALCQRLGLEYGAVDLICEPSGEFVFLEVNGNGQFLWAEQLSGVAVSDALARLLTGIAPPLKSKNSEERR